MTIETLQQANKIQAEINQIIAQLNQIDNMLDETKGSGKLKTRVKGMDFEIPKAALKSEVTKQKTTLEAQLTSLENEFSAL